MCPGPFGATMITSCPAGGGDPAVVDREAVREEQRRARREVRRDLVAEELRLRTVGDEHRDDLGAAHRLGDRRARSSPASSAAAREALPARRPTSTSTPESARLSAWAWPWLP